MSISKLSLIIITMLALTITPAHAAEQNVNSSVEVYLECWDGNGCLATFPTGNAWNIYRWYGPELISGPARITRDVFVIPGSVRTYNGDTGFAYAAPPSW